MKRKKRSCDETTNNETTNDDNWNEINRIIRSIVDNEKNAFLASQEKENNKLHIEIMELKRMNTALEYKATCFENSFNNLEAKYMAQVEELRQKVDAAYCVSCGDSTFEKIVCKNGHANCKQCIQNGISSYISYQTYDTKHPKCLKCLDVFDDCQLSDVIDSDLWGKFISERTRMNVEKEIYSTLKTDNQLKYVLRRPCCGKSMMDFEGCAALKCEYCENAFYCAFCFELFDNSDDCHKHVSSCIYNTEPTYHIISDTQISALRQCWKNILMDQLSQHIGFDMPNPITTTQVE
tara:strand:+ start:786 stop:1664 length:879 start_codon:yes stop_codon:yes gene_type:complete